MDAYRSVIAALILLHGPEGQEIRVNSEQITSLRAAKSGEEGKHFTEKVKCMVSLADGKYVTVVETCEDVQQKIRSAQ